jgi:hypothetical protein
VSSQFCDANHRLLFRILETSRDANIRSNIAIALGDVAVSFSTIIDENSDELYKGLSDRDLVVKKNTLMVLTHLILNGMIKVKGQLGEMAKCLEDEEPRVADLVKLFFTDLSTKDNAIYNNLPDGACVTHAATQRSMHGFPHCLWALKADPPFTLCSHQPPISRRPRDGRRRLPTHDALHLHIHRKGMNNIPPSILLHPTASMY